MDIRIIDINEYRPQIAALWLACFPEDDAEFIDYYISHRLIADDAVCFAAFDEKSLVSMINVIPQKTYYDNKKSLVSSGFIVGVCTHSAFRGQGISRKIMDYLSDYYGENKALSVLQLSTEIPAFYEKSGFETYSEYCPAAFFTEEEKANITIYTSSDMTEDLACKLLDCYKKNAKDGYFKKTIGDMWQMADMYEEIRVVKNPENRFEKMIFVDKAYENSKTFQMAKYLDRRFCFAENTENY